MQLLSLLGMKGHYRLVRSRLRQRIEGIQLLGVFREVCCRVIRIQVLRWSDS